MFKRIKLKKEIKKCIRRITLLEQRRSRSQAALVSAILTNTEPNDQDVDYFNEYTLQIDATREAMHKLQSELDLL